jgi:hypothetical protein
VNHLGTLGDEEALVGMQAVAQLGFGEGAEHFHTGVTEVCDTDNRHDILFIFI